MFISMPSPPFENRYEHAAFNFSPHRGTIRQKNLRKKKKLVISKSRGRTEFSVKRVGNSDLTKLLIKWSTANDNYCPMFNLRYITRKP